MVLREEGSVSEVGVGKYLGLSMGERALSLGISI